jgi:hypothetical protein
MRRDKYSVIVKYIDHLLLLQWKVFEALLEFVFRGIARVFRIFSAGRYGCCGVKKEVCAATVLCGLYAKFSHKISASARARRYFFICLAAALFLYFYPPSHWGPWYEYQRGRASCYGSGFWFRRTAGGDIFIPLFYTAAHRRLKFGTVVKVVNEENGKSVYVKINDRGPYIKGRIIDLSTAAARKIGIYKKGTGNVIIYTHERLR